ncbi:MAG: hypothetical protein OXG46_06955 [Chloroflexi bacterium]|nr:hypothetical protein [Chloroflexota bacterium]MCY3936831.1 hypothetical protein [Chloroflexota bacterium]
MTMAPIEERLAHDIKWMKWTMVSTFLAVTGVLVTLLIQGFD